MVIGSALNLNLRMTRIISSPTLSYLFYLFESATPLQSSCYIISHHLVFLFAIQHFNKQIYFYYFSRTSCCSVCPVLPFISISCGLCSLDWFISEQHTLSDPRMWSLKIVGFCPDHQEAIESKSELRFRIGQPHQPEHQSFAAGWEQLLKSFFCLFYLLPFVKNVILFHTSGEKHTEWE